MIFKSLCLQKPLLKSQDFGTCYAGRGLRSGTPRWGYPSHRYRGGPLPFTKPWAATPLRRPLPASHVQMIVTNDESFLWLATPIWHWQKQKNAEWYCGKLRCNSTNGIAIARHVKNWTAELFTSSGQGLFIFDPLDNRNPTLRINYQKVSWLKESQEVGMKWGLGRSTSFHISV